VRKTNGGKEQNASQRDVINTEEQTDLGLQILSTLTASLVFDIQSCVETEAAADKKEKQIFLIYKESPMGSGAKSYLRKGFLTYEEMCKYFPIYEEAVCHR
jgi:hypothetical protein